MSPGRTLLLALLVALAGCTGAGAPSGGDDGTTTTGTTMVTTTAVTTTETTAVTTTETTADTTEPHTARGTSHAGSHLSVRASYGVENVTVALALDGDATRFDVDAGAERSFTREIHDREHDVRVVVERDGEVVFDRVVRDYQYYQLTVDENGTSVTQSVV